MSLSTLSIKIGDDVGNGIYNFLPEDGTKASGPHLGLYEKGLLEIGLLLLRVVYLKYT